MAPLGGMLMLIAAITALLLAPEPEAHTWRGALARAVEHRGPILAPVVALAVLAAVIQLPIAGLAAQAGQVPPTTRASRRRWSRWRSGSRSPHPRCVVAAFYLAVRWAVAVPVLVMEGAALRRSLARSVMLTRGRSLLVGGALLAAFGLTGLVGGIVTTLVLMEAQDQLARGGGLVVLLAFGGYLLVRIVLAPFGAILPALLYRELRLTSGSEASVGRTTNAGPAPRRSDGVP